MKQNTTIIRKYAEADLKSKIDIIFKYYPEINSIDDLAMENSEFEFNQEMDIVIRRAMRGVCSLI